MLSKIPEERSFNLHRITEVISSSIRLSRGRGNGLRDVTGLRAERVVYSETPVALHRNISHPSHLAEFLDGVSNCSMQVLVLT